MIEYGYSVLDICLMHQGCLGKKGLTHHGMCLPTVAADELAALLQSL